MKTIDMSAKTNVKRLINNLLMAVIFFTANLELLAQETKASDLKSFKIIIEKTTDGIKLQSMAGSAWTDLDFSLKNNQAQAIDEYGMTILNNVASLKDANLADFLFTIARTKTGFVLKGLEGTAWGDLSFSLADNQRQAINQLGLVE
jgi:hypothetical protein